MSAAIGWALAVFAIALGYVQYGWPGVLLALGIVVFWLLLQFSRTVRAMRTAGERPVGRVDSAVMLNAKLRAGMRLVDVITLTRSLGERMTETPEVWRWRDDGEVAVELAFERGRLARWSLQRPAP